MNYLQIPNIQEIGVDEFDMTFRTLSVPVIIKRFGKSVQWPAFREWSLDFLSEEIGDCPVNPAMELPKPEELVSPYDLQERNHRNRSMKLKEFVDLIQGLGEGSRPAYVDSFMLSEELLGQKSRLKKSYTMEDIVAERYSQKSSRSYLWIGTAGTRSGFHYDKFDNFFIQVVGIKRVYLGSPSQVGNFYPYHTHWFKSRIVPESPDLRRFPKLRSATIFQGDVGPGSILFIPRGWWHHLVSIQPSISLSNWHGEPISEAEVRFQSRLLGHRFWLMSNVAYAFSFLRAIYLIVFRRAPSLRLFTHYDQGTVFGHRIMGAIKKIIRIKR